MYVPPGGFSGIGHSSAFGGSSPHTDGGGCSGAVAKHKHRLRSSERNDRISTTIFPTHSGMQGQDEIMRRKLTFQERIS